MQRSACINENGDVGYCEKLVGVRAEIVETTSVFPTLLCILVVFV